MRTALDHSIRTRSVSPNSIYSPGPGSLRASVEPVRLDGPRSAYTPPTQAGSPSISMRPAIAASRGDVYPLSLPFGSQVHRVSSSASSTLAASVMSPRMGYPPLQPARQVTTAEPPRGAPSPVSPTRPSSVPISPILQKPLIVPPAWTGLPHPTVYTSRSRSPAVLNPANVSSAASVLSPKSTTRKSPSKQGDKEVAPYDTGVPLPVTKFVTTSSERSEDQVSSPRQVFPRPADKEQHSNGMVQQQGVYSPLQHPSTSSNAPPELMQKSSSSESNKAFGTVKPNGYLAQHNLQEWWESMVKQMEEKQPECPYEFIQEQLHERLRERKLFELDDNVSRSLMESLSAVSDQGDRLCRFDALLVALNMVSEQPSVDPLSGDTRLKLELMLADFDIKPTDEIDDQEVLKFLKDAIAARAISREGYRQPHLMLNFDVNQTILMVDSISGTKEAEVINDVLSNHGWGKIFPEEASDENNNVGAWKLAYSEPYVECPEPGLICYADYVAKVNTMPTDRSNREELNAVRKKRRTLRNKFTDSGHPGEALRMHHRRMMDGLQLPAELKGTPAACSVGLEGHTVLLLPCFLQMLIELKKMRRGFTLLFRTYGLDLGKVQKELNAFCEGRHPLFKDTPRFDGSDGEPDYRMALDSVTQSGTWYREMENGDDADGTELFVLIMGTVAQPSEKPKKGDILGMPFFEHLKAHRQQKLREQHAGDLVIGEIDDGIEILKGADAVNRFCSFCEAKTVALRDFFPYWQQRGQKADGGKPLFIDRSNLHKVLPIFFDDNCSKTDAKIVDVRSASRFLSNCRQRSSIDISESYGLFVQQAEPLLSVSSPMYYIDKVKMCEANHRELMRRRGQLGELVGRLLQVPKHELKVVVRQAAAASMYHSVRSTRRLRNEDTPGKATSNVGFEVDEPEGPRITGAVRVIAVTSGLACGGEQVVEILRQLGATIINCRKVRMETYFRGTRCHAEILQAMAQEGKNVLGKDQEIDHLIDQNPILHEKMNKIVWPHVNEAVQRKIQELDEETQMGIYYTEDPWMIRRVVVIHASDLVESGLLQFASEIWTVTADVEARARVLAARGMPPNLEEARAYILNHIEPEFPPQEDKCIVRLENTCYPDELREKVVAEWRNLHCRMHAKQENSNESVLEVVSPEDELIGAAPVSEVWNQFLWHRMVFVVIRHQSSGGFYAAQRSLSKSYMPGRWDLAVFGRPQNAAVPAGGSAAKVACEALKDKLGVSFPEESLVEITKFDYRGALTSNIFSGNGRVSFIGIVFEAFLDVPVENLVFNNAEVQRITILSPNECLAMQQEQLVPMTSCAYDAYSAYFFLAGESSKVPNIIATPGERGQSPTAEDVASWVLPGTDFSSGLFILGLSGHDLSSRRDVSAITSELGATVIDCQRVARQCYQKGKACFKAIVAEFGNIVIGEDGEVNQRLLAPLLQARPEMLKRIQDIIRPHLQEALKQRILRIQEDHREMVSMKERPKQLVRKVVVLENAVLNESGLVYFCDEMWTVQNNWDDLTRRRVLSAPKGKIELKNTRMHVTTDSKCKTGVSVEIKVETADLLRSDVVWQWQELHRRMYKTAKVLDGVDLENCPVAEVCDPDGRCVGVSPLPWIHANCLVHQIAVTVLRNRATGHFYVTRRSFHHQYLPGALDLAVIGNPGIMEVRCGESPEDASARALKEILGIRAQVQPERIGEFPYQGVWRAWPTLENACTMFGVLFEAFVDIPLEDFVLDKEHAVEIMYVSGAEVMALPRDTLAPITACYFNHYWATRMGCMSIRGRR